MTDAKHEPIKAAMSACTPKILRARAKALMSRIVTPNERQVIADDINWAADEIDRLRHELKSMQTHARMADLPSNVVTIRRR